MEMIIWKTLLNLIYPKKQLCGIQKKVQNKLQIEKCDLDGLFSFVELKKIQIQGKIQFISP